MNQKTAQARLQELAGMSNELARIAAKNSNTNPELLRELAASTDGLTRKEVASNPNTPTEILWKLGEEFPNELLNNSLLTLLMLEDSNLLANIPYRTLNILLQQDTVPVSFLEWVGQHFDDDTVLLDEEALLAVITSCQTPKSVLEKLTQHWYPNVSALAKIIVNWSEETSDRWDEVAKIVKQHSSWKDRQDSQYQEQLWAVGAIHESDFHYLSWETKCKIAKNPKNPAHLLQLLTQKDCYGRMHEEAIENSNTPASALEQLVGSRSYNQSIRKSVTFHPNTLLSTLQQFYAQLKAVQNPETSPESLRELAQSRWEAICENVALHDRTPIDVKQQLKKAGYRDKPIDPDYEDDDVDEILQAKITAASNPNTPSNILEELAKYESAGIREALAQNLNLSLSLLEQLARDDNVRVRRKVAENLYLPLALLEQLAKDKDESVRCHLAENPSTPVSLLEQFATDDTLCYYVAGNPSTPVSLLEQLVTSDLLRYQVAGNPNTPVNMLEQLATDNCRWVLENVASNPNTPVSLLEQLATNKDSWVRQRVARNHNTPVSLLEQMAVDPDHIVRLQLASNPNIPVSVFRQLAVDGDFYTRRTITKHPKITITLLKQIARDIYNRTQIDNNPNISIDVLAGTKSDKEREIIKLKALDSLTIADRNTIQNLQQLAKNGSNYSVREAAIENLAKCVVHHLQNSEISAKWLSGNLDDLPGSEYEIVRDAIAQHPNTPLNLLEEITKCNRCYYLEGVILGYAGIKLKHYILKHPHNSKSLIERISKHEEGTESEGILEQLANSSDPPMQILEQIAGTQIKNKCISSNAAYNLSQIVAGNSSMSGENLQRLAEIQDGFWSLSEAIASHCNTPANTLAKLAQNQHTSVRRLVALNQNTPISVLQKLAVDPEESVRDAVIENLCLNVFFDRTTSATTLQQIAEIKDWRVSLSIARHPNTPATVLENLAKHRKWQVRLVVTRNLNTPEIAISQLVEDKERKVREAAIANPNLPQSVQIQLQPLNSPNTHTNQLEELANSQWLAIRERVALHPNTPTNILEKLAQDKTTAVRLAVAQNPRTPANILENLVEDKEKEIAIAVAANPNTPVTLLEELAQQQNQLLQQVSVKNLFNQYPDKAVPFIEGYLKSSKPSFTRLLVFLNPHVPSAFLAKNFRSSGWLERYAIAQNPHTPINTLKHLIQDGNSVVRAAAKANLQQRR